MKLFHSSILMFCLAVVGCSSTGTQQAPQISKTWLDGYEANLRDALAGSTFEVDRTDTAVVVTAPVDSSFNPKRPEMLLPSSLAPITKVAKLVEKDTSAGVLIVGHGDNSLSQEAAIKQSQGRARAVGSIFRLSGLKHDRLQTQGMGAAMPLASNGSEAGRAQNRRVLILVTQQAALSTVSAEYAKQAATKLAAN